MCILLILNIRLQFAIINIKIYQYIEYYYIYKIDKISFKWMIELKNELNIKYDRI